MHLSFSFILCSHLTNPACHSQFLVTIRELSMVGKNAGAKTCPPMPHSGGSTTSWHPLYVRFSQNMSPVQTTQLTDHPVARILPLCSYSCASPYPMRLPATSLISTTPDVMRSAFNIDFTHLCALATPRPQVACLSNQNPRNCVRMGSARHIETVPPYPLNLTPILSDLRLHCAAKDQLEMWLPHPDSLTFLGPPETLKLQGRVKAVTLEGWAESTCTTYGARLLVYHVFCDSCEIPEKDCAPARATLVSSFISALTGSLSGKAIQNYVYGVRAWHTVYRLPWALHKDQIVTMLKGAMKLAPPTVKQNK